MGNRRMMLIGAMGVAGVAVCIALFVSAMRSANAPEVVAVTAADVTPAETKRVEPVETEREVTQASTESEQTPGQVGGKSDAGNSAEHVRRGLKRPAVALNPDAGFWEQKVSKEEARVALSSVGVDPGAEAVWWLAINDLSLDPEVRKDLIEDLNEDGLSDPKHPAKEDLPLIESRISLIEALSREPMDDVNGEAFAEAYKDLLNMRGRLVGW